VSTTDPYRVLQVLPDADQEVVRAAYRALALKYHPDRDPSPSAARRMAQLNEAFALVRDAKSRTKLERDRTRAEYDFKVRGDGPAEVPPPPRSASAGTRLEQGRYSGWTLRDLANHDPDYLRWLSRHSSGLRYRNEIMRLLAAKGVAAA
jgi:curved DNA-binding protein CbpA